MSTMKYGRLLGSSQCNPDWGQMQERWRSGSTDIKITQAWLGILHQATQWEQQARAWCVHPICAGSKLWVVEPFSERQRWSQKVDEASKNRGGDQRHEEAPDDRAQQWLEKMKKCVQEEKIKSYYCTINILHRFKCKCIPNSAYGCL